MHLEGEIGRADRERCQSHELRESFSVPPDLGLVVSIVGGNRPEEVPMSKERESLREIVFRHGMFSYRRSRGEVFPSDVKGKQVLKLNRKAGKKPEGSEFSFRVLPILRSNCINSEARKP